MSSGKSTVLHFCNFLFLLLCAFLKLIIPVFCPTCPFFSFTHALKMYFYKCNVARWWLLLPTLQVALFSIKYTPSSTNSVFVLCGWLDTYSLVLLVNRLHLFSLLKHIFIWKQMPNELRGDYWSVFLVNSSRFFDTGESLFLVERKCTWLSSLWVFDMVENCQIRCITALVLVVKNAAFMTLRICNKKGFFRWYSFIKIVCFTYRN